MYLKSWDMRSNYRPIGEFIRLIDQRNKDLKIKTLLGLSIDKVFIASVANIIGADMANYKVIRKGQFACSLMQVRRDKKMPVALLNKIDEAIISQAYPVFEIIDKKQLLPEYLMMWMTRSEFDRHACFLAVGGVRGSLEWEDFCDMELPVPSPEKQREIVREYNVISDRIKLNENLNQRLEETAQAIYKHWFVENGSNKPSKKLGTYINFNPKHSIKKDEWVSYVEMADIQESHMTIKGYIKRIYTSGSKFMNEDTLLARITPCLENGKTAYINTLNDDEVAYGSTEFIVMRAKGDISPYWVYCLARDKNFRDYAISSMVGSSGRQRVHSDYLEEYLVEEIDVIKMKQFNKFMKPLFLRIKNNALENARLVELTQMLLSKISTKK
jgi:type I restriction enzyme, S subunit